MDIHRVNLFLNKAISFFQESESEVMAENIGFTVPSPSKFGFNPSWKPKPPSAFGFERGAKVDAKKEIVDYFSRNKFKLNRSNLVRAKKKGSEINRKISDLYGDDVFLEVVDELIADLKQGKRSASKRQPVSLKVKPATKKARGSRKASESKPVVSLEKVKRDIKKFLALDQIAQQRQSEKMISLVRDAILLYFKLLGKKKPTKTILKQLTRSGKVSDDFEAKMGGRVPYRQAAAQRVLDELLGLQDYEREYRKLEKAQYGDYRRDHAETPPEYRAGIPSFHVSYKQKERGKAMNIRAKKMSALRDKIIAMGGEDPWGLV